MIAVLSLFYTVLVLMIFVVSGWSFYNLPILIAGVRILRAGKHKSEEKCSEKENLPVFSIVVPIKGEEKVIARLLDALSKSNYPSDKKEIIVVEDGSTDRTIDVCLEFKKTHDADIKILHRPLSDGKSSALNYGIKHSRGEIIGIFDADNIPARDSLLKVRKYFEEPRVAAVQGRTLTINSEENMLTKFISYEEAVWFEAYLRGKDVLNLFVNLKGSCQFIRRDVLEKVDGFDTKFSAEDMELSAKIVEHGYQIRYAPDVQSWQESPSDLKQLFRQRTRWYRGWMQVSFKYGRLMAKPTKISIDAEATLLGPFMLIVSLATYLLALLAFFMPVPLSFFWQLVIQFSGIVTTLLVFSLGAALVYVSKPRTSRNLLWLPFIYSYWCLQAFLALYAAAQILLRRQQSWLKTEKRGTVKSTVFQLAKSFNDLDDVPQRPSSSH